MIVLSRERTKISRIYSYFAIYRFRSFIFMIRLYEVEAEFFLFLEKFIWKTKSFDRTRRQLHHKCNFRPHEFLHPLGWVDGKVIGGCMLWLRNSKTLDALEFLDVLRAAPTVVKIVSFNMAYNEGTKRCCCWQNNVIIS